MKLLPFSSHFLYVINLHVSLFKFVWSTCLSLLISIILYSQRRCPILHWNREDKNFNGLLLMLFASLEDAASSTSCFYLYICTYLSLPFSLPTAVFLVVVVVVDCSSSLYYDVSLNNGWKMEEIKSLNEWSAGNDWEEKNANFLHPSHHVLWNIRREFVSVPISVAYVRFVYGMW